MVSKHNIEEAVYAISILIISIAAFENIVQPILAFIHPMFIDHGISVPSRGSPTSPAEGAWVVTGIIILLLSFAVWPVIKAYLPDIS
jgi:hypothetical protein